MPACPASPHGWVVGHITTAGSRVPCEVLPSSSPNFILSKHHNILLVLPKEAIAVSKRKQRIRASQSRQIRYFQFGAAALLTSLPTSAVSIFDFFFYISPMFIIKTHHHHLITTGIESNFAQEHSKIREHQFKLMQKTKCSCFAVLQRNQDQHMSRYNPYLLNCSAGNWVFGCFFSVDSLPPSSLPSLPPPTSSRAVLRPSPYPVRHAAMVASRLAGFPHLRPTALLRPGHPLSGSRSCRQLRRVGGAGAWRRRDMALPDIMGRPLPTPALGRAGFQRRGPAAPVVGHEPWQSAVWLILARKERNLATEQPLGK